MSDITFAEAQRMVRELVQCKVVDGTIVVKTPEQYEYAVRNGVVAEAALVKGWQS